jgi:homoserine kinase type II
VAVYTEVPAEALEAFLADYAAGPLRMAKGIAEGVSNTNYLVETSEGRYVLTLYERRIDVADLPWFIGLMEHLADAGLPVPRPVRDRGGLALKPLLGRTACLIAYLPGFSVTRPTPTLAEAAGEALARLHLAGVTYGTERTNALGPGWWQATAAELGDGLEAIEPGLATAVAAALTRVAAGWPTALPRGVIHADLFPDNVLVEGERVTGLIDFYFACTDFLAYDLAVLHAAWAFPADGARPDERCEAALMAGYEGIRPLTAAERAAFPLLAQGAALRFLLSRAQDWLAAPSDALVTRKDPRPFARRLAYYAGC